MAENRILLGNVGLTARGTWSASYSYTDVDGNTVQGYETGDTVVYNNSLYESLQDGNTEEPSGATTAKWRLDIDGSALAAADANEQARQNAEAQRETAESKRQSDFEAAEAQRTADYSAKQAEMDAAVKTVQDKATASETQIQELSNSSKATIQSLVNALPVTQTTGDSETSVMSQKAVTENLSTINLSANGNTYNGILNAAASCTDKAKLGAHIIYNDSTTGLTEMAYMGSSTDTWSSDISKWVAVGTGQDAVNNGVLLRHAFFDSVKASDWQKSNLNSWNDEGNLKVDFVKNVQGCISVVLPKDADTYTVVMNAKAESVALSLNVGHGYRNNEIYGAYQTLNLTTEEQTFTFEIEQTGEFSYILFQIADKGSADRYVLISSCRVYKGKLNADLWNYDDRLEVLEHTASEKDALWADITNTGTPYVARPKSSNPSVGVGKDSIGVNNNCTGSYIAAEEGEIYRFHDIVAYYGMPVIFFDAEDKVIDWYKAHNAVGSNADNIAQHYKDKDFELTAPAGTKSMLVSYCPKYCENPKVYKATKRYTDKKEAAEKNAANYTWAEKIPFGGGGIPKHSEIQYGQGYRFDSINKSGDSHTTTTDTIPCKEGDVFKVDLKSTYALYVFFSDDNTLVGGYKILDMGTDANYGTRSYKGFVIAPEGATQVIFSNGNTYGCGYVYKLHYENDRVITENSEAIARIAAAKDRVSSIGGSRDNGNGAKLLTIAHLTDIHCDNARYENFRKFVDGIPTIDVALNTGDLTVGQGINDGTNEQYLTQFNDELAGLMSVKGTKEVLQVVGNHEKSGEAVHIFNDTDIYNSLGLKDIVDYTDTLNVAGKLYYVKKYSSTFNWNTHDFNYNIWLVILDQYDTSDFTGTMTTAIGTEKCLSQAQVDWLINVLQAAVTAKASVIICMHDTDQSRTPAQNDSQFYQEYLYDANLKGYDNNITSDFDDKTHGTIIEDIVDAFKKGAAIKHTYTFAATATTVNVDTTFASKGSFVCYITGHTHKDLCGYSQVHSDQLYLNSTCGCLVPSVKSIYANYGTDVSDLPRVAGTKTEDAFNVYAIDLQNSKVKVVRVGSDLTGNFKDRKYAVYDIK